MPIIDIETYKQSIRDFFPHHIETILRELKQAKILLTYENIKEIIQETSFKIRSKKHPDKCPYYKTNTQCLKLENNQELNCFLCACPNYYSELPGACKIKNPENKAVYIINEFGEILDCSRCLIPHLPETVEKFLKKNIRRLKNISDILED